MRDLPSIVWINLESVRYDHTSLGGYHRDTTPNLERISKADTAVSMNKCFAHSHWTAPSCSSMLTGTTPSRHGIGNGNTPNNTIPDAIDTVPELLSAIGYNTVGLTGNGYSGPASGLDRGFDRYTFFASSNLHRTLGLRALAKYIRHVRQYGGGFTTNSTLHNTSLLMTDVLKREASRLAAESEPYFMWTHYGDTHHPYTPPRAFRDQFIDEIEMSASEAIELSVSVHENLHQHIADGCPFSDAEWEALIAMYDSEIAHVDWWVGKLYDHIQSIDDNVIFVITGDHGELFGESNLISHKLVLNDATTRVPLVIDGLPDLAEQQSNIVQHVDVITTILHRIGADTTQLQGVNLFEETREFAVSEASGHTAEYEQYNPEFDYSRFCTSPFLSVRTNEYRYQRSTEHTKLFELPDEETDVSAAQPAVHDRLDQLLTDWLADNAVPVNQQREELSEEMQAHLKDMGYV